MADPRGFLHLPESEPIACGQADVAFSFDEGKWCFLYCPVCTRVTWDSARAAGVDHATWYPSAGELVALWSAGKAFRESGYSTPSNPPPPSDGDAAGE